MNIKFRIVSSAVAVITAGGFLTALALSSSGSEEPLYSTPQELATPDRNAGGEAAAPSGFWVGELDGHIAVWHNGDRAVPLEDTGIAIRSLRAADQEMLRAGVFFDDYIDVVMFLEDFGP